MADLGRARCSQVQPGTVLKRPIVCYIFEKHIKYDTVRGCCQPPKWRTQPTRICMSETQDYLWSPYQGVLCIHMSDTWGHWLWGPCTKGSSKIYVAHGGRGHMPNSEYCLHKYYFKQRQIQLKKLAQILFQTKTKKTEERANYQMCFDLRRSMTDFLPKEILTKVPDPSILIFPMEILEFMYIWNPLFSQITPPSDFLLPGVWGFGECQPCLPHLEGGESPSQDFL